MWLEYDILYQSFTMLCNQVDLSAIFRWCILHLLDKRLFSFVLCSEYNVSCTCQSNFSFFRFLTHFLFCSLIFFLSVWHPPTSCLWLTIHMKWTGMRAYLLYWSKRTPRKPPPIWESLTPPTKLWQILYRIVFYFFPSLFSSIWISN